MFLILLSLATAPLLPQRNEGVVRRYPNGNKNAKFANPPRDFIRNLEKEETLSKPKNYRAKPFIAPKTERFSRLLEKVQAKKCESSDTEASQEASERKTCKKEKKKNMF